jgi:3'(2'), 5'-bisphosphate nucleotidase
MPIPFALEKQVAIAAVRRACALTTTVFNKLVAGETLLKGDKSPVTGAAPPPPEKKKKHIPF